LAVPVGTLKVVTRVLVVEDEHDLANLLVYNLKQEGYETDVAHGGAAAIGKLESFAPSIVVLDLMLPDVSGLEVLRKVRSSPPLSHMLVMMLTAKGAEADRIRGFELGADDYVVKPFSVKEVLLRIAALLRRVEADKKPGPALSAGAVRLDPNRHEVTVDGKPVVLTALEFRLLRTFLERPGRIQSREVLLSDVWGISAEVETRTVDTHIKRLRQKLGMEDLIETVRGVGYRLVQAKGP
jgi:two-component system phosphate regulon response regulator PhoB